MLMILKKSIYIVWYFSIFQNKIVFYVSVNFAVLSNRAVIAWTSPSHPFLKSNNTIIDEPITDDQEAWLGSCIYLVALVSSPLYSYINQNMGRKLAGYLTVLPLVIGWIIIGCANSVALLFLGRLIQGLSFGGVNVFQSMYVSEISEDDIRGTLGAMRGVSTELGSLAMYSIGPYLGISKTAFVSLIFPLVFLMLYFCLPESPMFLLGKKKHEKAMKAYLWFRRGDVDCAQKEFDKLSVVIKSRSDNLTVREILFGRDTRNAMVIAIVLNVVMRLCGVLVVFSYISKLTEISGSTISLEIDPIIVGVVSFLASIFGIYITDKAGRRRVLISSLVAQGLALVILGIFIQLKELHYNLSVYSFVPLICLCIYCGCVIPGISSTTFIVISEIFRPEARGLATAITCPLSWFLAFASTQYHHNLENWLGLQGCYWFYGGVSLFGAVFTYVKVPETKNRSLESILRELNGDDMGERDHNQVEVFTINGYVQKHDTNGSTGEVQLISMKYI